MGNQITDSLADMTYYCHHSKYQNSKFLSGTTTRISTELMKNAQRNAATPVTPTSQNPKVKTRVDQHFFRLTIVTGNPPELHDMPHLPS